MLSIRLAVQRYLLRLQMRDIARRADAVMAEIGAIPAREERALAVIEADRGLLEQQRDVLFARGRDLREAEFWLGRKRTHTPAYDIKEFRGPADAAPAGDRG